MLHRKPSKVLRTSGHEIPMGRHFLGLDDEILGETRGTPTRKLPEVNPLTELPALLFSLKDCTTIVISVEEIRLFNADNHESVRFRFPRKFCFSKEEEERIIRRSHSQRLKVIQAITSAAAGPTLTTVSFIPGGVDHIEYGMHVLEGCWQTELSDFCAALHRNPNIRHVHIETKLCEGAGWSLNIEQLLNSSLVELSLPDLKEQGWRDLATGLAWNRTLQVLTLRWNAEGMDILLLTSLSAEPHSELTWTECNKTLETVWISCPREFDVQADAEAVASMLHRFHSVPAFVIEYTPPEPAPSLLRFASLLRQALLVAPNVRVLHLLVPFRGLELSEHILKPRTLAGLVLVLDRYTKADLEAVGNMARESETLKFLGLRHQNPKKRLSLWKCLQRITEVDVVAFLGRVGESNLHTLSLRGWGVVDGKKVLSALVGLMRKQTHLEIDLTGTGLALKNMLEPVNSILHQRQVAEVNRGSGRESKRSVTTGSSASHPDTSSSPPAPQAGRNYGSVYMKGISGAISTSGSSCFERRSMISEHGEFDTEIRSGPGSVWTSATVEQQQQQQQPQPQHQQPRWQPLQNQPLFFSSFSYDQLEEATGKFQTVLGTGGFGKVYLGELASESGKKKVAVKDLKLESMGPGSGDRQRIEKSFEAEVKTLGLIHHVNLVRLLGYCAQNARLMLVYEFMPNSSLDQWIFGDDPNRLLGWEPRKSIAVGIARGLEYLHFGCEHPIIHLDVKPQNILLDANLNAKLADFGIAKLVDLENNLAIVTQVQGTRCYMAPEIQLLGHVTRKSDVFSYGLLLIELIRGKKNGDMQVQDEALQQRFFPSWARSKFQTGHYLDAYHELRAPLLSPSIPGYQAAEAQRMLCIAIACINEDMDMRPDMKTVLLMLEGEKDVLDPSRVQNRSPSYDFRIVK